MRKITIRIKAPGGYFHLKSVDASFVAIAIDSKELKRTSESTANGSDKKESRCLDQR